MSDRRTREQHRRKFQELINYENQNVSEAIPQQQRRQQYPQQQQRRRQQYPQ